MSKKEQARKTSLLTIATAIIPWAIQQVIAAQYYRGGVALAVGIGALVAYEHFQIKQIPTSADEVKDISDAVADAVQDATENRRSRKDQ